LIFCHADNLNTDGIYPGKYTYVDDITPEQMAKVVMENYDPKFADIVSKVIIINVLFRACLSLLIKFFYLQGDILVGGFNFGTGSSREQAATAIKASGITFVIAGSFSETFKRNSINNALLCLEAPDLVHLLKKKYDSNELTTRTKLNAEVKVAEGKIIIDGLNESKTVFEIGILGRSVQELWVADGLENWVRQNM
jgi:homoaconitate hydratase